MAEPDFIYQSGVAVTNDARREWLRKCSAEAEAKGATHFRASVSDQHRLILLEAWKTRPADEGEPRFHLALD